MKLSKMKHLIIFIAVIAASITFSLSDCCVIGTKNLNAETGSSEVKSNFIKLKIDGMT